MTMNTVGSVGASVGVGAMQRPPEPPKEVTKAGLEEMKKRIEESGGQVPEGLDKLIENFDEAAGDDGKMTFEEFKAYAKDNGVELPEPPKGGPQGPPPSSNSTHRNWMSDGVGKTVDEFA